MCAEPSLLITLNESNDLAAARDAGVRTLECSLDLHRSRTTVDISRSAWRVGGVPFPYPEHLRERTIYRWTAEGFAPVARYSSSLVKLVPTEWGAPTFEIDGIKMLPTMRTSPYADAERKVALIQPRGKTILDTCGGLGYFAAWAAHGHARHIVSYEKNADVLWLRGLNPWSPADGGVIRLNAGDVTAAVATLGTGTFDAVLHDPPRFGIAGELYSRTFYDELARLTRRRGRLFHYTGAPNSRSRGRDLPGEVMRRLARAGFDVEHAGDGILGIKR
jgi:predicted methyltransferase